MSDFFRCWLSFLTWNTSWIHQSAGSSTFTACISCIWRILYELNCLWSSFLLCCLILIYSLNMYTWSPTSYFRMRLWYWLTYLTWIFLTLTIFLLSLYWMICNLIMISLTFCDLLMSSWASISLRLYLQCIINDDISVMKWAKLLYMNFIIDSRLTQSFCLYSW